MVISQSLLNGVRMLRRRKKCPGHRGIGDGRCRTPRLGESPPLQRWSSILNAGVYVAKPEMPSLSSFSIRGFLALVSTFASGIWIEVRVRKVMPPIGRLRITPVDDLGISDWRAQEGAEGVRTPTSARVLCEPTFNKGPVDQASRSNSNEDTHKCYMGTLGVSRFIGEKTTVLYDQVAFIEVQKR